MNRKGFSNIALLIILVVIVAGVAGYFVMTQKSTIPTPSSSENSQIQTQPNTQGQITNWAEYKWGVLKFRYPSDWKVEAKLTSVILTPPARTSSLLILSVQAASDNSITIGGGKSCATLGQEYRCETAFGLPIYTASNNSETIAALEEISKSATLIVSSRDSETGLAIDAVYMVNVNTETYTENELNSYLKKAPAGQYDILAASNGYKAMLAKLVLPVSQVSSFRFMMDPLIEPVELSNNYLQQFTKSGTGLLVGYVVDEDGQPLAGVAVNSPVQSATTNNRGFYALNVTIPPSGDQCAGIDVIYSKSGYKTEKHPHAMSGSVVPHPTGGDNPSTLWDTRMNITLQRGSGENVTNDKHILCP